MYALVDANSFYASCEQVFRPELRDSTNLELSDGYDDDDDDASEREQTRAGRNLESRASESKRERDEASNHDVND